MTDLAKVPLPPGNVSVDYIPLTSEKAMRTERAERARGIGAVLDEQDVIAIALTFVDNAGISRVKRVGAGGIFRAKRRSSRCSDPLALLMWVAIPDLAPGGEAREIAEDIRARRRCLGVVFHE